MSLYKQKVNPRTGQFNLVPSNNVLVWKASVASQTNLPLTGNVLYDARMVNDTQHLYVWTKDEPTGLLTDWADQGDILDLTWAAISGKPSSSVVDIDDSVSKKHSHANKATLDLIQEALTTILKAAYDGAVTNSHTHANKATLDNIQEAFTTALKSAYDSAVTNSHTHANKTTLDNIQEALTTVLKAAYDGAVTHAGLTSGNPHNVSKSDVGLGNVDNKSEATIITDVKAESDIADAISKKHTQGTDQYLDQGGANQVTAADTKDAVDKKHATSVQFNKATAAEISALSDKATPVDADVILAEDSAGGTAFSKIKITWANIKATLKTYFDTLYGGGLLINEQTDTYALVLSDASKLVDMNKGTAVTLTVPKNAVVAFPIGTTLLVRQKGAGQVTIAPVDGDVTINNPDGLKITNQYGMANLIKVAENTWTAYGSLEI
jgi:hypothetical protein